MIVRPAPQKPLFKETNMAKTLSDFDIIQIKTKLESARRDVDERVKIAVYELTHPMNGKIALDNVAVQIVGIAGSQKIVVELQKIIDDMLK